MTALLNTLESFFANAWTTTAELAPWLLLGLTVAGLLHVLLPANFVRTHLGRPGFAAIFKAAAFGVPLPLCSCGVIPATVGLKKDGASDGACTAFLVSTPQTGVDSIAVSAAFLGWPFALYKVVAALLTGLFGGWLVDATDGRRGTPLPADTHVEAAAPRPRGLRNQLREFWEFTAIELLGSMWQWILLGILVSAAIATLLPPGSFAAESWLRGPAGLLLMLAISLPLYVCATGSVPIAAALVAAGLPPGAALVFLMAGPASNAATIGAIWKSFGRRVTLIYLGVIAAASLLMGWAFDWVLRLAPAAGHPGAHLHGEAAAGLRPHLWAAILAAILAAYAWRGLRTWWERRRRRRPAATAPACACGTCAVRGTAPAAAAAALVLRVSGMSCGNCAQTVERALRAVPGVASATVDLAAGEATVTLAAPAAATPAALVAALAAAGYPAEAAR